MGESLVMLSSAADNQSIPHEYTWTAATNNNIIYPGSTVPSSQSLTCDGDIAIVTAMIVWGESPTFYGVSAMGIVSNGGTTDLTSVTYIYRYRNASAGLYTYGTSQVAGNVSFTASTLTVTAASYRYIGEIRAFTF